MEKENIFQLIIDLLHYHKSGSLLLFHKSIKKALGYYRYNLSQEDVKKISRIIYRRFCEFCIIENYITPSGVKWAVRPNSLINIHDRNYLVCGESSFISDIKSKYSDDISIINCYIMKAVKDVRFEVVFNVVNLTRENEEELIKKQVYDIVSIDYKNSWEYYPDIKIVKNTLTERASTNILSDQNIVDKFSFKNHGWEDVDNSLEIECGFYRVRNKFGDQIYLIIYKTNDDQEALQIKYFEWAYLLSSYLLGIDIDFEYTADNKMLKMPASIFGMLPLLIRRILLINNFNWPSNIDNNYCFNNISHEMLMHLSIMYPSIKVQEI